MEFSYEFYEHRKKIRKSWELYSLGLEIRFNSFPEQIPEYLKAIERQWATSCSPVLKHLNNCEILRNCKDFKKLRGITFYDDYEGLYFYYYVEKTEDKKGLVQYWLRVYRSPLYDDMVDNRKDDSFDLLPSSDPVFNELNYPQSSNAQLADLWLDYDYKKNHTGRNCYYFKETPDDLSPEKIAEALKELDVRILASRPKPKPAEPKKCFLSEFIQSVKYNCSLIILALTVVFMILGLHLVSKYHGSGKSHNFEIYEYELPANARFR